MPESACKDFESQATSDQYFFGPKREPQRFTMKYSTGFHSGTPTRRKRYCGICSIHLWAGNFS